MHQGFFYRRLELLGFTRSTFVSHICSTDSIPWVDHSREEGSLDYDGRLVRLQVIKQTVIQLLTVNILVNPT
jgi:hypothetical protein